MAYNNGNKKTYNRAPNNNQAPRPKKAKMTFPVVSTFGNFDRQGNFNEIDHNQVIAALEELCNNKVFDVLTTPVSISRALIMNDNNKKGSVVVGFVNDFNLDEDTVDVTIYATSVESVNKLMQSTTLILDPRINGYNGEFRSFTGFNLVPAEIDDAE